MGSHRLRNDTGFTLLIQLRDTIESGAKLRRQFRWDLDYYFGSIGNAKLELKTDIRVLNGWGPSRVILEIQRRHRLKLSLVYAVVLDDFPALVGAAETYFGGLVGDVRFMPPVLIPICISSITHGGRSREKLCRSGYVETHNC